MASFKPLPPLAVLQECLEYDPATGVFRWIHRTKEGRIFYATAGSCQVNGYSHIQVNGARFKAHRLAWLMHHKQDPGHWQIDHINRNRADNRIANLRLADGSLNRHNTNTKGIEYRGKSWQATIQKSGQRYRQRFATEQEAIEWRAAMSQQLYGNKKAPADRGE